MIKNIMKNIGTKPAEVKEKPKNLLPSGINADDVSTEDLQSYMQSIQENIDSMPTEEEMKNSKIDFSLRKSQLGSKKKELEALRKVLIKRQAEEKEPFLIQGMTKDKYIPWRMDAHGETKAQAESAWNHAEEQAKNKEKKPLTSPDLIPSYDDFNPLRD